MIAYFNNAHVKLPSKNSDDRATPGWYYAWDSNNLGISEGHVDSLGGHWDIPVPTGWIVADTNAADGGPVGFEVGSTWPDLAMTNQETLRLQVLDELPGLNTFVRLYEDDLDLTPMERMAAPVDKLWWPTLQDLLLTSPHIVSLGGPAIAAAAWVGR